MNQITNTKAKTNQKPGPTHQAFKNRVLSLFAVHSQTNKRGLSADSLSLFLSALRPRLLLPLKIPNFGKNSRKITVLLAILSIVGIFCAQNTPVSATSLTLSVPSSLSLNISPSTSPSGFFAKSTTPGKISISTDNSSGYTLSIKAKTDNSLSLTGSSTASKLLSLSSSLTEDQYKSSGNLNTWAYMPSKLEGTDNVNFLPGPTLEGSTIDATESANAENNDYDLTLAAKVDNSIPAGTYSNAFVISALANAPKIDGIMQEWAKDYNNCENLGADQIVNLQDSRDGNVYRVAKLADGKCWMIDNLRIVDTTISNQDSDIYSDIWDIPGSNLSISGRDQNAVYYPGTKDSEGDDYGAYYSWYAATAGTGASSMDSGDAMSSICPKGWRLPEGGPSTFINEFSILDIAMGGTGSRRYDDTTALNEFLHKPIPGFTYAGYVGGSSLYNQGDYGYYWSSTSRGDNAYALNFDSDGNLDPPGYLAKFYGRSVRCIASEPKEFSPDLLTQQFTPTTDNITIKASSNIDLVMIADSTDKWRPYYATPGADVSLSNARGKTYILSITPDPRYKLKTIEQSPDGTITAIGESGSYPSMQDFTSDQCTAEGTNVTDTRNNVSYTVAKIGDRCWMLSNLRLASETSLTSADSNVDNNFTTPIAWSKENNKKSLIECHGILGNDSTNSDCNQSGPVTEYYYSWHTAKANTSSVSSNGYSICPKNWTLPNYNNDITADNVWNGGTNPGMLATAGVFVIGPQVSVGSEGFW